MLTTIATATKVAAPYAGRAALAGGKALVGLAIATKAGQFASTQALVMTLHADAGVEAVRQAKVEVDTPTEAQARKTA